MVDCDANKNALKQTKLLVDLANTILSLQDQASNSPERNDRKGVAVFINNPFDKQKMREGSEKDVARMRKLFKEFLGFKVYTFSRGFSGEVSLLNIKKKG